MHHLPELEGSYNQVALCRREFQFLSELRRPCRVDVLSGSTICISNDAVIHTLVPQASEMHVAAMLDTIRAL
jgi:hypothetical protein